MRGLDTNVLLRYLIQDDLSQGQIADAYIRQGIEASETFFINNIVLCEMVWVLRRAYKFTREQVIAALEQILQGSQFQFEDKGAVHGAIQQMKTGQGDFSDYLIGKINQQMGCQETATFDRKLQEAKGFKQL